MANIARLMDALMTGLTVSNLDYEIIEAEAEIAWVEVDGVKYTVRVERRD